MPTWFLFCGALGALLARWSLGRDSWDGTDPGFSRFSACFAVCMGGFGFYDWKCFLTRFIIWCDDSMRFMSKYEWFQQETSDCHQRSRDQEKAVKYSLAKRFDSERSNDFWVRNIWKPLHSEFASWTPNCWHSKPPRAQEHTAPNLLGAPAPPRKFTPPVQKRCHEST